MSRNKISREVRTFFSGSNQLVYGWQMGHKVKELRQRLDDIVSESEKFHFKVRNEENASLTMIREATTSSEPEIFFGREDEKKKVKSFLLNPKDEIESVSVISIVGMGGLGKTTFAQSIFNDEQVNLHFGLKLWVSVSGGFDVKKILKDVSDELESLKKKLQEKIENRKYLLVLDDVWDNKDGRDGEKWDCLKQSLPHEAARGNKMIITTRSDTIANLTSKIPLALKGLSEKDSWSLFSNKAFGPGQESNYIDEKIKKEIVERCQGVPLSIQVERGGNRISELTRHVSFDTILDLSQQIPIPLPCAKSLRTLVLFQGSKRDKGAWVSICRDFRCLRVLVLSDFGMKEVSPLIEKIKHLKYLDLSNNKMEALSNSVTSLVNLQVLKLNDCSNLKELPRDISKLISLRHLDVGCTLDKDLCENLEYMPRGIGKLTSLQTLSCFVVAKKESPKSEMIGGLDELRMLNELRGRLEIRVKGYEGSSCISEFEGAKLIDKEYLQSLTVRWDPYLDRDSDIDLYDKMLQSLQPNSSLQELRVEGYGGMRFPSWVSNLSNLASIVLKDCGRLKHIPPLDGIPSLEELIIWGLDDLEYIDSEGVGGKGASTFFPSLKRLDILDCASLKGWWKRWSRDEMNDDSDESTIEEGFRMLCFPRLSSLFILMCPNLTSMPLFPTLDELLFLNSTSSMPLQQTMKMTSPLSKLKRLHMWSIDDMESLPEVGLQNLSSLQQLSINGCKILKSLPLPDQGMPSLQRLHIRDCSELKSLSESESQGMIPYLPSLQFLRISGCSGRTRGWGKEREEEWPPNIKHIPDIVIEGYYIQKEGRYVEGMVVGLGLINLKRAVTSFDEITFLYIHIGHAFPFSEFQSADTVIGLGFDKVEKVINDDFIIEDGTGWIRALQACDKLDRNLFTLHTLHIHFICRTKLQLQSKTLIQSQMVESSVHSGVVWINQTPDIHIKPGAGSLEDEGLRCWTVLMNFSPTKLDHDVYSLKGGLQGFNWLFAARYMLSKEFTIDELNSWRVGLSRSATLVSLITKKPTSSGSSVHDEYNDGVGGGQCGFGVSDET
ncbi:hypothetical protein POTOM_024386 [Populus tomentosa]|uniref:NB-ARC domain-containing protein n=1 Tax=Populus tomentosa TaxID=118781 RepID=A0A8X8CRE9_POPTO|nr:hypothetical protein POTOM_024386 [Populus tomentosa]